MTFGRVVCSAGKVLAVPKNLREPWSERVAIMVTDGGQARERPRAPGVGVVPGSRRSAVR